MMTNPCKLYLLFASLLEYPAPSLPQKADDCANLLVSSCPMAYERLIIYRDFVHQTPLKIVQEIYTQTFDLQGFCYPYVGHHLFSESYKRSWFMARLNQGYHERGFIAEIELPDHLAVILRFLALGIKDEFCQVLKNEGAIPAVEKMVNLFDENDENPYKGVLLALSLVFREENLTDPIIPVGLEKEA